MRTSIIPRVWFSSKRGFTLLEVLVGVAIFTIIMGTIYSSLRTSLQSWHHGEKTSDLYQRLRAGLRYICSDISQAQSPKSRWNVFLGNEEDEDSIYSFMEQDLPAYLREQENTIIFRGSASSLEFVAPHNVAGSENPFDLKLVKYSSGGGKLSRNVTASIVEIKMGIMRAKRLYRQASKRMQDKGEDEIEEEEITEEEQNFRQRLLTAFEFDPSSEMVVLDDLDDLRFSYFDGEAWLDNWDSDRDIVVDEGEDEESIFDDDEEDVDEEEVKKMGLPRAVRIEIDTEDGHRLVTTAQVPVSDLNEYDPWKRHAQKHGLPAGDWSQGVPTEGTH